MQGGYSLFGAKLVERGVITQQQLDEAIKLLDTELAN